MMGRSKYEVLDPAYYDPLIAGQKRRARADTPKTRGSGWSLAASMRLRLR